MDEHSANDSVSKRTPAERYRYDEYERAEGSISIIQDTQNESAWIQSTHVVPVER